MSRVLKRVLLASTMLSEPAVADYNPNMFRTTPIYASEFGEKCDGGATDNAPFYQKAVDAAVAQNRPVEFGSGGCVIRSSVLISGALPGMWGKGEFATTIIGVFNGPLFKWAVNSPSPDHQGWRFHDMTWRAQVPQGDSYAPTRGLVMIGDAYTTHGVFDHIRCQGQFACIEVAKGTSTTPFGQESKAAWNRYESLTIEDGVNGAQYGVYFTNGSGTGNVFTSPVTAMSGAASTLTSNKSAFLRYEGSGTVVGDIVVSGGHFGGVNSVVGVGPGTVYRQNISVCVSQLDAGTVNLFDFATDGPNFGRLNAACGNNMGGGVQIAYPPAGYSLIDDQLVDQKRSGTNSTGIAANSSQQSIALFAVSTSSTDSQFYGGTSCEIAIDGLIGNVASGITKASYLLPYGPGGYGSAVLDRQVQSTNSPSFFGISAAVANGTVTFSTTYTAANGGKINDAQIVCRGGTYAIKRLL